MKIAEPLLPSLLARLRAGDLLVTANQRAARTMRRAYDQTMQHEGHVQWFPANVFALDAWLDSLWRDLLLTGGETRLLLNRIQEHTLWRAIVAADPEVSGLRSTDLLAEMAAQAWAATCRHNGRERLREFGISTDTRAFERWAREFEQRANRAGYLPAGRLPGALGNALAQSTLSLPETGITLVDFDQLPPALEDLLEQIDRAGYPVQRVHTTLPSTCFLAQATDDAAELEAAAHWCRERLEHNGACRIAVVVPALADRRSALERAFAQILTPQTQAITAPAPPALFEFSLGQPLARTAPCEAALDLLRWTQAALPLESISALLLSPFFGASGPEALLAADFDVHTLRQLQLLRPELSLEAFLDRAANPRRGPRLPHVLLGNLDALHRYARAEHLADQAAQQSHEDWSDAFRAALAASGWTAATDRDSLSWQTRQRWESALDELATLDFDGARPTAADALLQLTRIVQQTIFAPESGDAPVQILGPLELGGVAFDHLWFLGADDLSWPILPSASPLIPWAVQQSLGLPGADATRDRRHARALTERIAASAQEVVFSYAQHAEEGTRRPSPLLADLNLTPIAIPPPPAPADPIPLLEHLDAIPIAALPDEVIEGGASILQAQAACAFRAFAEKRLRSAEPETTQAGLNPRDRGSIVHDVMEHFWSELEHQDALLALTLEQRHQLLDLCIDQALTRTHTHTSWDRTYIEVQRERLRQLLRPWLAVEAARPPFAVREHEREEKGLVIGPLRLTVRIDRVDETEAGLLILDYKTGNATPSEWLSDRPDQPQIPLYAVLADPAPAGVAFALLRPGDGLALRGFADDSSVLAKTSGQKLPMAEQVGEWRLILENLAADFAAGDATVAPKCYPKTCQYCAQRILCRLDVTTLDDAGDEAEGESTYG